MTKSFNLREVTKSDLKILLEWRNDKITRQNSIHENFITLGEHKEYLNNTIISPNRTQLILEYNEIPVGTIRQDILQNDEIELSYTISPMYRGKKIGQIMMSLYLVERQGSFSCRVLKRNIPSIKMIEKFGFKLFKKENNTNIYKLNLGQRASHDSEFIKNIENKMTTHTQEVSIKNKHTVLVVVAHTDDETLGLGGTIAKHFENGDTVYGVSMTDGIGARRGQKEQEYKERLKASINAGKILGLTWLEGGNFPDNAMDSVSLLAIVKVIENAKLIVKPTLVYAHSSADLNIDHRLVSEAILTVFRPQPYEICQEIRTFEVPSATDYGHKSITNLFYPNLYVDITRTWEKKFAALHEYKMEMRDDPHSRSFEGLENLAKYRGNQVGLKYAEAFEVIRKIAR